MEICAIVGKVVKAEKSGDAPNYSLWKQTPIPACTGTASNQTWTSLFMIERSDPPAVAARSIPVSATNSPTTFVAWCAV